MGDIRLKNLTSLDELKQVQELEEAVWGMPPIPVHQTLTAIKNGGVMIGALDGERLVGFNYGFPGFKNGEHYLCSHMMGIHKDYRKRGIGYALKMKQMEEARRLGYSIITWTFDPLESVNGYLNLTKLKGIAAGFIENLYGDLDDDLNAGLETDRFRVEWWINTAYVRGGADLVVGGGDRLVDVKTDRQGHPMLSEFHLEAFHRIAEKEGWLVPIPSAFQELKKQDVSLARDWRKKTRQIFQHLMSEGFVGVKVLREKDAVISDYVFVKRSLLRL